MGYRSPMVYEILSANIIPLVLVDLIQIFFCSLSSFCTYSKFKSQPWGSGQDITESMWKQRREKIRWEEGCCGREAVMHWDCGGDLLL